MEAEAGKEPAFLLYYTDIFSLNTPFWNALLIVIPQYLAFLLL
jgi:hypothetical protein